MSNGLPKLFDLSGRVALVTGASRGIGRAIALGLAQAGADIIVHYSADKKAAQEVADAVKALGRRVALIQGDFTVRGAGSRLVADAIAVLSKIDIAVLNASTSKRQPFAELSPELFDRQVNANFWVNIEILQGCLPLMSERGWGRVVTIGSVQQVRPNPALAAYSAIKSAQVNLVMNLARQSAATGVTVNNVAPGLIETDRTAPQVENPETLAALLDEIPVRSVGQPEDCVGPVLMLCSEAGRYITGTDLFVDGGMHLPGRGHFIAADGTVKKGKG